MGNTVKFLFIGMLSGIGIGINSAGLSAKYSDVDFTVTENRVIAMQKACAAINSTPHEHDTKTVTCKNGASIEYKPFMELQK